jgi:rhodanese-related sulfurtransferase
MITMKQLLSFIPNHWPLCTAAGAVLAFLIFEELKGKMSGMPRTSVQDATLLLNREHAVTIDLRNQKAFASGHILDSINIVRTDFDAHIKKIESHKNHIIILVDDTDTDVASIGAKLQKNGFTKIYILAGGLRAWKDAQLPLIKNHKEN